MRQHTADGIGAGTSAKIYINFKIMLFKDKKNLPYSFLFVILSYKTTSEKSSFLLIFDPFSAVFGLSGDQKTSLSDAVTSPGGPYGVSKTKIFYFFEGRKRPRFSAVRASRGRNSGLMRLQRGRRCNAVRAPLQPHKALTARLFQLRRKSAEMSSYVND